jgi:hypothetical protein
LKLRWYKHTPPKKGKDYIPNKPVLQKKKKKKPEIPQINIKRILVSNMKPSEDNNLSGRNYYTDKFRML